jgi:hypothetical protein
MNFVANGPLFACLFDQSRQEYVGTRIGNIVKVTASHVECGGVEFRIAAGRVFPTLAGAEACALALNTGRSPPLAADNAPSSPDN